MKRQGYLPCFVHVTEGKVHEVNVARTLELPQDSIVAMDRGYNDYELFLNWTKKGIWFVTRMKDNARYRVIHSNPFPHGSRIISDEVIEFSLNSSHEKCPIPLRRVVAMDDNDDGEVVFLTNNMKLDAQTIADIYRERWRIETFFRTIKQNFRIKSFVGTSFNAVMIQIWTALIAILVVKMLMLRSSFDWSLSNLVALLSMNLFIHKDLIRWLNEPYYQLPPPEDVQLQIAF